MKRSSIVEIVRILTKVRDKHHDRLGASALSDLNGVIEELQGFLQSTEPEVPLLDLADRALRLIATVVETLRNFTDGM